MAPILAIKNISKRFGNKQILKSLSLDINSGEVMGLLGLSGCGKSTLIKILVGYYKPDKGTIIFDKKDIAKDFNKVKHLVGYTTQENSFYEKLTVYENMQYYANLYNLKRSERKSRINELLKAVKLDKAKKTLAENISGGMKRRLDFALSILHNPQIVILDEPTTGLDPVLVKKFWQIVSEIVKKENIAVLASTHHLAEVSNYCDKAAFMSEGGIKKLVKVSKSVDLEKEFDKLK